MVMKGDAQMLTIKRVGLTGTVAALALVCAIASAPAAKATTTSDDAAAILVWPKIVADDVGVCVSSNPAENGLSCDDVACTSPLGAYCKVKDTLIQMANLNPAQQAAAHCFYINANSHCTNDGSVCTTSADCTFGAGYVGVCRAGWSELDFDVRLTLNQPLAWRALEGLSGPDLPMKGNAGTRVPPVPETPFIGELKCIQVDPTSGERLPAVCSAGKCPNDLIGEATIEEVGIGVGSVDPKSYNAVGIQNVGSNDGNNVMSLDFNPANGGEYEPCPGVLVLNHMFDGAVDPISNVYAAHTELTLASCSEDLLRQICTPVTAQFLVYNEFEQRFSTSIQVPCLLDSPITRIDTSQPARSIFAAGVSGTVAGQTRIQGVNGGLLGVAVVNFGPTPIFQTGQPALTAGAAYNLNQVGGNRSSDAIVIP
jgi:hypothetical protein